MKIGIFGGSFDPIHTDHINIIKTVYKAKKMDEIWIIPTTNHAFDKKIFANKDDRFNMIKLAIKDISFIKLKNIEINNNETSYTFDTISKLKHRYPDYIFYTIIGSDNANTLDKWKNIDKLNRITKFIVFKRKNYNIKDSIIKKYNFETLEYKTLALSSTKIRNGENIKLQIPQVTKYINKNGLYIENRLKIHLNNERMNHSLNVGKCAYNLAKLNNIDPNTAQIAGNLHDITKFWTTKQNLKYINQYCSKYASEPISTLHAYSGYAFLKHDLLYNDEICQAVRKHTTASQKMSMLDKIIFVSDKISNERNYPNVDKLRKLCFSNIELGFKQTLKNQYSVVIAKHKKENIGKQLIRSYKTWVIK